MSTPTAVEPAAARPTSARPCKGLPHVCSVLGVWAAATLTTLVILRLGARDTPATAWAPASPSWAEHITFWDAGWYNRIHETGYPSVLPADDSGRVGQSTWAFMPLLPRLAELLGAVTGWSFYVNAALVSTAASAGAAVATDRWLAPAVGRRASLWAVALVWSSPCAAVLQVPYAESLGLLFTALALAAAARGHTVLSAPAILLAAFSRPIGAPLTLALGAWWLWEVARAAARGGRAGCSGEAAEPAGALERLLPGARPTTPRQRLGLLGLTAFSAVCTLAWPALAWAATRRSDAYTATETAWRGGSLAPFVPWWERSRWWAGDHLGWVLLAAVLVATAVALAAPSLRRLGAAVWFWCAGYVAYLLAFFDPTTSVLRLLFPLAPAVWALSGASTPRRRFLLLAACVVGQVLWVSAVWDPPTSRLQWVP